MDIVTYALCKKIASAAASGIERMWVEENTLYIETKSGETLEVDFPTPEDGVSVIDVTIDENQHLLCAMSNGDTIDAGEVPMYIPQRGVDYYTDEDKEEIIQDVIGSIDESLVLDII